MKEEDFFGENFIEESLRKFNKIWGDKLSKNKDPEMDFFENEKRASFLNRAYLSSTLVYPVFLYLKENDLLKHISENDEDISYPRFMCIERLIDAANSDKVPDHMKTSIILYLRSIEGFTYKMLKREEEIPYDLIEPHGYLQCVLTGLGIDDI